VPTFGQQGILNKVLVSLRILSEPSAAFLYSDLSSIIALIQLYSLFMAGPIFFSLASIRLETIEAAQDLGANKFQVFKEIILPLALPGVAIGAIFIFTITMGEFATVAIIGGGKAATVGTLIRGLLPYNQFPQAAANSVFLIVIAAFGLYLLNKIINIRKEL
jgi:putative spermidine/putrescine transport system permease protein